VLVFLIFVGCGTRRWLNAGETNVLSDFGLSTDMTDEGADDVLAKTG
jgi:hypothetical protein